MKIETIINVFGLFIWSVDFSGFPLTRFLRELQSIVEGVARRIDKEERQFYSGRC